MKNFILSRGEGFSAEFDDFESPSEPFESSSELYVEAGGLFLMTLEVEEVGVIVDKVGRLYNVKVIAPLCSQRLGRKRIRFLIIFKTILCLFIYNLSKIML